MQQVLQDDLLSVAGVTKPIIFYDDVCVMCNGFVKLASPRRSPAEVLVCRAGRRDIPQDSSPAAGRPGQWSMIYVDEAGIHDQSDASLEVYRRLGGIWWLLSLARFVPRSIRNPAYRVLARNRYRWFGKRDTCRLATADEKARFLE